MTIRGCPHSADRSKPRCGIDEKHAVYVVEENDSFFTMEEQCAVQRQRRDVAVDEDRLDTLFFESGENSAGLPEPSSSPEDEQTVAQLACDHSHMMTQELLLRFKRGQLLFFGLL